MGGARGSGHARVPEGGPRRELHGDAPGRVRPGNGEGIAEAPAAGGDRQRGSGRRAQGHRVLVLPRRAGDGDRGAGRAGRRPGHPRRRTADRGHFAGRPPGDGGRAHERQRTGGAGLSDPGGRRGPEHPGRVGGHHRRAAADAIDRGAGDRPRAPDGPGSPRGRTPAAVRGQRRPANPRTAGGQARGVRRVRAPQRHGERDAGRVHGSETELRHTIVAAERTRLKAA